ncbi:MAG: ABC transporter permease [Candidatus Krumholzibacteriia bacterium]
MRLDCVVFSVVTLREQQPDGAAAAAAVAARIAREAPQATIVIVARPGEAGGRFAAALAARLGAAGRRTSVLQSDSPAALRDALGRLGAAADGAGGPVIATTADYAPTVEGVLGGLPATAGARVLVPAPYRWPTFLLAENLRNVANQIAVIAIVAIGMTIVIITAGIDLSVGSLIAFAAVAVAWLIGRFGGEAASTGAMLLAGALAVVLGGGVGAFSGLMITRFGVPPFIATLGMMQVASGVAYIVSRGKPIYEIPASFVTLGRGADPWLGVPYAVVLMLALYAAAHLVMSRTALGRHVYAVGGNPEAARLAGVRVKGVLMFAYVLCGALAGLGGVVTASQLKSGAPTYGLMYELYVIAAVVVGGTSLSGGEGRILGTLIGAFIIAVIQNGMNLTNVESYTQKVVLGLVILGAVLLDRLKQRGWRRGPAGARGEAGA